jgi:hypothetical protein
VSICLHAQIGEYTIDMHACIPGDIGDGPPESMNGPTSPCSMSDTNAKTTATYSLA